MTGRRGPSIWSPIIATFAIHAGNSLVMAARRLESSPATDFYPTSGWTINWGSHMKETNTARQLCKLNRHRPTVKQLSKLYLGHCNVVNADMKHAADLRIAKLRREHGKQDREVGLSIVVEYFD